ncbi:hypothetical protein M5689_010975 [Euphorbia peplus]|nr:hypothetical protein M5689_010975 [Euphorbia peplus]
MRELNLKRERIRDERKKERKENDVGGKQKRRRSADLSLLLNKIKNIHSFIHPSEGRKIRSDPFKSLFYWFVKPLPLLSIA